MLGAIGSLRDIRHIDKTFFLGSDDRFYEPNYVHYTPDESLKTAIAPLLEASGIDWIVQRSDVWTHVMPVCGPEVYELPHQGWKVHISATNMNAMSTLLKVAELAIGRCIQFKFANDVDTLRLMTSKRWTRGGSGKFITVYPANDAQTRSFLEDAYARLEGSEGSYILSDRRYRDSRCIYYRYGGMRSRRRLDYLGRKLEVLVSPSGEEVLDDRNPFYHVPEWASELFPSDPVEEDVPPALNDGRYLVTKALTFSNTGGVYLATDVQSGEEVVIKEARPFVELGPSGADATTRLAQEAEMLALMSGTGAVPELYATFQDWENSYLVEEYLDAQDMRGIMLTKTPLLLVNPSVEDAEEFYRIYKAIFASLLEAVVAFHSAGVIIGDLSPTNIMVDEDALKVTIIDLEGAYRPEIDSVQDMHTPGFRPHSPAREKKSNFSDDLYAVGVIMMYAIFPVAAMAYLRKDVFATVLPVLVADAGWSETPVERVMTGLIANTMTCAEALHALRSEATVNEPLVAAPGVKSVDAIVGAEDGLARFITGNFRLGDLYTLFPIDPFGRHSNPLGFAFGATGIIHALEISGTQIPEAAMARFEEELHSLALDDLPPGFLTGTSGMAWALLEGGRHDDAIRLLDHANSSSFRQSHHSLYYGMAGIGMANLAAWLHSGEQSYLTHALDCGAALKTSSISSDLGVHWEDEGGVHVGFGYGQSGVALFFLRLSQASGDNQWREMGEAALRFDLSCEKEIEPGVVSFGGRPTEEKTLEQYIEQGSGGIAKVAIRYGQWDIVDRLLPDIHRKYSGFPGLIYGLAGFVDVFIDAFIYSGDGKYLKMAERPLRGLSDLYLFESDGGLATPGENLFRISCDYATGSAGVMSTLRRYRTRSPDTWCLDQLDGESK